MRAKFVGFLVLALIQGFDEQILAGTESGTALHESAAEIQRAVTTAGALVDQLLTFSRRRVTSPTVVDLDAIVGEMERMLRRVIGADTALRYQSDTGLWPVLADASQLSQVVLNLEINARDAIGARGGEIRIRTANERSAGLDTVVLMVEDDGSGMDAGTVQRAFEPFFTTKGPGQGSGLGLATVYGIVAQAGGEIDATTGRSPRTGHCSRSRRAVPGSHRPTSTSTPPVCDVIPLFPPGSLTRNWK